jgi:hypothetical protein
MFGWIRHRLELLFHGFDRGRKSIASVFIDRDVNPRLFIARVERRRRIASILIARAFVMTGSPGYVVWAFRRVQAPGWV